MTNFSLLFWKSSRLSLHVYQSWTWIGSIHGLDWVGLDWVRILRKLCGLDWVRWLQSSVFFFIYIFSILTTDKRWRCNTI